MAKKKFSGKEKVIPSEQHLRSMGEGSRPSKKPKPKSRSDKANFWK